MNNTQEKQDTATFEEFCVTHRSSYEEYIKRFNKTQEEAEDLVQESFLKMYTNNLFGNSIEEMQKTFSMICAQKMIDKFKVESHETISRNELPKSNSMKDFEMAFLSIDSEDCCNNKELNLLRLKIQGNTREEIQSKMGISEYRYKKIKRSLIRKLGV